MTAAAPDTFGLGAIQSPPDAADFGLAALAHDTGVELAAAPPPAFTLPTLPPVLDQDGTPMCVAYSSSSLKAFEDRRDQGKFFDFDEPTFFRLIGGGPNGAVVRVALDRLLKVGYPTVAGGDAGRHRIRAYYRIPLTQLELAAAIYTFGPLILSTPWYHSWFRPVGAAGARSLPPPDYQVGGHAILAIGYTPAGVVLRNSWGADWGNSGNVVMPWPYALHAVWEAWKALDVIEPPPAPQMHAAAGTYTTYRINSDRAVAAGSLKTGGFSATFTARSALPPGTGTRRMTFLRLTSGVYSGKIVRKFATGITIR